MANYFTIVQSFCGGEVRLQISWLGCLWHSTCLRRHVEQAECNSMRRRCCCVTFPQESVVSGNTLSQAESIRWIMAQCIILWKQWHLYYFCFLRTLSTLKPSPFFVMKHMCSLLPRPRVWERNLGKWLTFLPTLPHWLVRKQATPCSSFLRTTYSRNILKQASTAFNCCLFAYLVFVLFCFSISRVEL